MDETVTVILVVYDGTDLNTDVIDEFETLAEALTETRELWMEEPDGPQTFLFMREGWTAATMMRSQHDPELAITTYHNGRREVHRCHYIFDLEGMYSETDVTDVWQDQDVV